MSTQGSPEKPPVAQPPPTPDSSKAVQVEVRSQDLQPLAPRPDSGDTQSGGPAGVPVEGGAEDKTSRKRRRWRELRIEPNKQAFERVAVQFRKLAWVAPAALVGYGWVQGGTIYGTLVGVGVGLLLLVLAFVLDSLDPGDPK